MIPLRDDNRGRHSRSFVTYAIIASNVLIYLYETRLPDDRLLAFITRWGAVPATITGAHEWWTLLTSLFLHASWIHLGGNMLFLWIFGDNVEDVMGHVSFLLFYLLVGLSASAAQVWLGGFHSHVPVIGASGAISGVLAAYMTFFPRGRVSTLVFLKFFVTVLMLPAWVMIGVWIALQISQVFFSTTVQTAESTSIAYLAHVGGFVGGLVLVWVFADRDRLADQRIARQVIPEAIRWGSNEGSPG
jgi:membrane associated rhomboid family serine protease